MNTTQTLPSADARHATPGRPSDDQPRLVAHLRSEARKVLTTPLVATHAAAVVLIGGLAVGAALGQDAHLFPRPAGEQQFMIIAALGRVALVLLGVRMAVDEYRHGTATSTLALASRRHRIVAAKALVGAATGAVVGFAGQASTFLLATAGFASKGHTLTYDDRLPLLLLGAALAGAAWVAIGVAVGELVRSTLPAVVGTLVWVVMLEDVVATRLGALREHLPGAEAFKLFLSGDADLVASGAVGMALWAVALGGLAAFLVGRRDLVGQK